MENTHQQFSDLTGVRVSSINEKCFPLIIQLTDWNEDHKQWFKLHKPVLELLSQKFGALLFRGFQIDTVGKFEGITQLLSSDGLNGDYGDLPREADGDYVYTSTPYPEKLRILYHNESSHQKNWPSRQFFCCLKPAVEGGATPLVDCREVYNRLNSEIRDVFEMKQVMYTRNYIEGLDTSWSDFFKTTSKEVVREMCEREDTGIEWKEDDVLKTTAIRPAVITHPNTNEKVFFNQIQLHHPSQLKPSLRESLISLLGEDNLPRNVFFGNGDIISDEIVHELFRLYEELAVRFDWEKGDFVMLDNMLVAHGRDTFVGDRKIIVALGNIMSF